MMMMMIFDDDYYDDVDYYYYYYYDSVDEEAISHSHHHCCNLYIINTIITIRPVIKTWRLNERMYGALEGHSKPGITLTVTSMPYLYG